MKQRHGGPVATAPILGLIGPIGCGKSTVAGWLSEAGAAVVDADELTRTLMTAGSPIADSIVAGFGQEFLSSDGSVDRAALGRVVFSDPSRLLELEAIVHPAVEKLEREAIRQAEIARPTAIVLEAIKLVEVGHAAWCDEIWLVICEPGAQLARLVSRGMAEVDARQRIAAQAPSLPLWRSAATRIIRTDGNPDQVHVAVSAAFAEMLRQVTGRSSR
jgi:dephospho-CoA kinase